MRRRALEAWRKTRPASGPADFARDVFPALVTAGERLRAYATSEYIKDIGTPERLDKLAKADSVKYEKLVKELNISIT